MQEPKDRSRLVVVVAAVLVGLVAIAGIRSRASVIVGKDGSLRPALVTSGPGMPLVEDGAISATGEPRPFTEAQLHRNGFRRGHVLRWRTRSDAVLVTVHEFGSARQAASAEREITSWLNYAMQPGLRRELGRALGTSRVPARLHIDGAFAVSDVPLAESHTTIDALTVFRRGAFVYTVTTVLGDRPAGIRLARELTKEQQARASRLRVRS